MKVLLVNPPLRSFTNRFGVGFQLPLGLLMVGGPLVDAGHQVSLLDADALGLTASEVAKIAIDRRIHAVLVGHSGATASNPVSMDVFRAIKTSDPSITTVYGGVYATYAADMLLQTTRAIDVIVRGEGEQTAVNLFESLSCDVVDLSSVKGISWRDQSGFHRNADRPVIADLDQYRVGWELADWSLYRAFGVQGSSAGIQFSRGCPRTCTYCGQWGFWKRWRHRSVKRFADDVQLLHDKYAVHALWIADENWGDEPSLLRQVLGELASRRLDIYMYCSMCASDVFRDLQDLSLYREAGIRFILMGVESADDRILQAVRKNNPHEMVKKVIDGMQKNGILSVVNYIFGIRPETHRSMARALSHILDLDADYVNALYFTPHGWTSEGRETHPDRIIQLDQSRWCYRNQVIDLGGLSPWQLFFWVKFIELTAHLRPRSIYRMLNHPCDDVKGIVWWCFPRISAVWIAEFVDQLLHVRFRNPGPLDSGVVDILLPSGVSRRLKMKLNANTQS